VPITDTHAVTSGGNTATALTASGGTGNVATIALGGDGATVAGLPIDTTKLAATLVQWGGLTTIADTIEDLQLYTQDQWDNVNGEWITPGASSLLGSIVQETYIPYQKGKRVISMQQNTAAANNVGFFTDAYYDSQVEVHMGFSFPQNKVVRSTTYGGALTALTWRSQAFTPTQMPPDGKYVLLGVSVNALTNHALIRFQHSDFNQYLPGFPVIDQMNTTVANAVLPKWGIYQQTGRQFAYMSQQSGQPMCPVFHIKAGQSGLNFQMLSITADTPIVTLFAANIGE